MPLIKPRTERTTVVRYITQLYAENYEELHAYAAFIGESPAYILNALIDTLKKDTDYRRWRAAHPESCVPAPMPSKRGRSHTSQGPSAAPPADTTTFPRAGDRQDLVARV